MPKVSVIIPVYGVEKYIEKCARSLFEQTLTDMEFIFIDDCTPDKSIVILSQIVEEYKSRIVDMNWLVRIVRMPANGGQAVVRNHGIQIATGDYIIYCDSDDWVESSMYEVLYKEAIAQQADLVFCDYYISKDTGDSDICVFNKDIRNCCKESLFKKALVESTINSVWSLLVKRCLFRDINYPKGAQSEDKTFVIQLCYYAESAVYVKRPLYHYRQAPNSISHSDDILSIINRYQQLYDNREIILAFMKRVGIVDRYRKELQAYLFETRSILNSHLDNQECRQLWMESFPGAIRGLLFNNYISIRKKIIFYKNLIYLKLLKNENTGGR